MRQSAILFSLLLALESPLDTQVRVYVTSSHRAPEAVKAETVDHMKKSKHCRDLLPTLNRERADYTIVHDDTGAGMGRKPQKIAVFNRDGDFIYSNATRSVGAAVKDACKAILADIEKLKKKTQQRKESEE